MAEDFLNMKTNFGMGFTIQSILEENGDLLKINPHNSDKEKKDDDPWACMDAQAAFLGPNIWGSSPNADLKLEHLDLEDFLNENELLGDLSAPLAPASPAAADGPASPLPPAPLPPAEPQQPPPRAQKTPARGRQAEEKSAAAAGRRERATRPRVAVKFRVSPADLALATAPGVDFDPQTRQFSDDELKPQPMCKKSKKQVVPDERKDQKYWTRRERNNFAAKRSRDARRLKENQIVLRANFLEKENAALRESIEEITRENERLKAQLESCSCL